MLFVEGFFPSSYGGQVGQGGAGVLGGELRGSAPGLAALNGGEVVAGIAVRPTTEGSLVCLALALKLCVASGLRAAFVDPAPRLVGEVGGAAQLGAAEFGLRCIDDSLGRSWLRLLSGLCMFACVLVEGAQVSVGEAAV